jgi:outer membrane protein OmpA-like peptidoglycan-associated protein
MVGAVRRSASLGGDGHDYFASMTDLMLGLVFIFIIVLMVVALNMRQSAPMAAAPAPVATPPTLPLPPSATSEANLARRDLLRDIAKILAGALVVTIDEENGTLQLGGDVLFPTASADAYPETLPKLRLLAEALAEVLPCYAVASDAAAMVSCDNRHKGRLDAIYIEGHTDTTPIHTARFQSNWELSAARASATFAQLIAAVPVLGALKNDQAAALIGVSGYGDLRPVDTSGTAAGMQRNRRIELRFIMATPNATDVARIVERVNQARSR